VLQPNREDEYARIEAEGGKVIQWNGYRVFGVLAMSRSIGTHTILFFRTRFVDIVETTMV
jgi:protein phosphatase 2C